MEDTNKGGGERLAMGARPATAMSRGSAGSRSCRLLLVLLRQVGCLSILRVPPAIEGVSARSRHGLGLAPLFRLGELVPQAIEHVISGGRVCV